jgi:hypothetical protein
MLSLFARIVPVVAFVAVGLSGCGGPQSQPSEGRSSEAAVSSAAASSADKAVSASPTPRIVELSAAAVVTGLAARVRSVRMSVVYTAQSDPNSQLGRPGQYTSKAAFIDARVNSAKVTDGTKGSTELGGGVEVFPDDASAHKRAAYIQAVLKGTPMLGAEYDYLAGRVLLRISGRLTPAQAETLKGALQQITGSKVDGPVQP